MTLLDKNGKPYRAFNEPNPILKEQESLEKDELVFHNFKWNSKIEKKIKNSNPPKEVEQKKIPQESEEVNDFLTLLKQEAVALKNSLPPKKETSTDNELTILVHCHPAIIREKKDDLYGETKKTIQYGKKFIFEALFVDNTDLEICLFTLDSQLTPGSVIYPSKYKNKSDKLENYRWWRISNTKSFKNGFLIYGEITDYQADFSD